MADLCSGPAWRSWLANFTIELAVFLSKLSHGVVGVLRTDLAIAKVNRVNMYCSVVFRTVQVCLSELEERRNVCANLSSHPTVQQVVQQRINGWEMVGEVGSALVPAILSLAGGTLVAQFGVRPLLLLPLLGQMLEAVALLANTAWFSWRLEWLWLSHAYDLLGGGAVWYLALYTFAAQTSAPGERAGRMARSAQLNFLLQFNLGLNYSILGLTVWSRQLTSWARPSAPPCSAPAAFRRPS